jgi:hypothetical protein
MKKIKLQRHSRRDDIQIRLEKSSFHDLIDLYKMTDPALGKRSAKAKTANARMALMLAGSISHHLCSWAINHLFGLYLAESNKTALKNPDQHWFETKEKWPNDGSIGYVPYTRNDQLFCS